jgi:succinoglycan biosynthesis transport protein ExoP
MENENKIEVLTPNNGTLERRPRALPVFPEIVQIDQESYLLNSWGILRKRRWSILIVFLVVFALTMIWTLRQKTVYRANALLEIEKENSGISTVQDLFAVDTVSDAYLETEYKILKSDSLAERVIDQLRLDQVAEFRPGKPGWSWRKMKAPLGPPTSASDSSAIHSDPAAYESTLEQFQDRLDVSPMRRSRLVAISFDSQDPALAARVVNALASDYIEQNLEAHWDAAQKASAWLSRQLTDLKTKLEQSEGELQKYSTDNGLLFLQTDKGNENIVNERLRQLQEELTKAQAARYDKESLYRLVQAGDYASLPGVFENKLMQDLTEQLADLKRQYAQLSTNFNPSYPKVKQVQDQIEASEAILAQERKHAAQKITDDYLAAVNRERLVRNDFEKQQGQANVIAERSVQYNILKREVDTNRNLYESLLQRLKEAGISAGLKASNIRIVDPGTPPIKPVKPNVLVNLAIGIIVGLTSGVALAFLQERTDKSVKTPEDVERFLSLPVLAFVPRVASLNGHKSRTLAHLDPSKRLVLSFTGGQRVQLTVLAPQYHRIDNRNQADPALLEAFSGLCTSVLLSTGKPPSSILITSTRPGEGKTTVAANLAIALAALGQRVLLVDADMRCPSLHKIFKIQDPPERGLVSYLAGQEDWRPMVRNTGSDGLDLLLCGPIPSNPVELLFSSERMQRLVLESRQEYKFVIIDSSPLMSAAESRILATLAEAVILVIQGGVTPLALVQRAEYELRGVGASTIGVVLNNLQFDHDSYYQHYRYQR